MPLIDFTTPYTGGPSFYTGTGSTDLVPALFPVALNGRPYMLDLESNLFTHQFEPRVRDSSDNSTAPGESAINPQGFWRRGQKSWHLGAGQFYADDADAQDFRFYKSKGVNPWTKGQLSLLNATVLRSQSEFTGTNLKLLSVNGYLYVSDGQTLKWTQDPYAASPSWTSVSTGALAEPINDITTDGKQVYVAYEDEGVLMSVVGSTSLANYYATTGGTYNYTSLGYAKGFILGGHKESGSPDTFHIHSIPVEASTSHGTAVATLRDPDFTCAGFAGGQNHIYVAGTSKDSGLVYRLGIKSDGTIDVAVVALELPATEYPTDIHGYLGFIILGTNKGVRFCSADSNGNLVAGLLISTTGAVKGITTSDRFAWFGWTNYDGTSGGLGRLDLANFIAPNTPAHATDLMYDSTAAVLSAATFNNKRVYSISGVGVIVEDSGNLVASGTLETGSWTWDIPDDKFAPKFDVRTAPLAGSVALSTSYNRGSVTTTSTFNTANFTAYTFATSQTPFTEAAYTLTLTRGTATTGPTLTRWMSRAWASPRRSEIITLPVILHSHLNIGGQDWWLDVETERGFLEELVQNPAIVTYQERERLYSVIVEDVEFRPIDSFDRSFLWEGTAVITLRTVAE